MQHISGKSDREEKEKRIEEILLENYDRYYRLAYSYTHNEADACDIVQNGAYRAIRNSYSLRELQYAKTWLYRIMLNEIFRFCNKENREMVSLEEMDAVPGEEVVYENIDLQRALEQLPAKDRVVVEFRFFEDLKLEDIAEILQENLSTVKSRLYRSMKKLRLSLED